MEQNIAEFKKNANKLYSDIRIALYRKHIKVKDIGDAINISTPTVTRTIQGKQWNMSVVEWVKDNLDITLPPLIRKVRVESPDIQKEKKRKDLDLRFKKYFTPREVGFYYGMSVKFLAQQRYLKIGIPYRKLGKKVLYLTEDIENYIIKHSIKIKISKNV